MQEEDHSHNEQEEQTTLFSPAVVHQFRQRQNRQRTANKCRYFAASLIICGLLLLVGVYVYYVEQEDKILQKSIDRISKQKVEIPRNNKHAQPPVSNNNKIVDVWGVENEAKVTISPLSQQNHENKDSSHIIDTQRDPNTQGLDEQLKQNPIQNEIQESKNKMEQLAINVPNIISDLLAEKDQFIPRQIWILVDDLQKESDYTKRCIINTEKIANKSGFKVVIYNPDSLQKLVGADILKRYKQAVSVIQKEALTNPISGYQNSLPIIKRDLINLEILHKHGGIVMDKNIILTEPLDWLWKLAENPYVNTGNPSFQTKYFGFYNANFSTNEERYNQSKQPFPKYLVKDVGLESFFLAGAANQQFLKQVLKMIYIVIKNPTSTKQTLVKQKLGRAITNQFIVSNAFSITCRLLLKQKEKLAQKGLLPMDYYGIKSINSVYFPKKIQHHFQFSFDQKIYRNLAKYTLEQFEQTVGPLRYMVILPFQESIEDKLKVVFKNDMPTEGSEMELLHPKCFLVKHLYQDADKGILQNQIQFEQVMSLVPRWENLPKIIWLEHHPETQESSLVQQMLYRNIKRRAEQSGFEVRTINPENFQQWLNQYELDWVKNAAQKAKLKFYTKDKMEIAKLSLLIRYGGVWLSRHFFAVQSFDWLLQIAKYPPELVFNRYGKLPEVVMYFHPHYGQPFHWTFDSHSNTKNMYNVALDSFFIAAQPEAALLKDWIRTFTTFLSRPYNETLALMARLQVATQRWTVQENTYFAMLDAVRIVLANKQRQISNKLADKQSNYTGPTTAAEYYRVWSISGKQGPLKLDRSFASINNEKSDIDPKSNTLIWRYPRNYTEGIIGKINKLSRIYHTNSQQLLQILSRGAIEPITDLIDPESIFYKEILEPIEGYLRVAEGQLYFV